MPSRAWEGTGGADLDLDADPSFALFRSASCLPHAHAPGSCTSFKNFVSSPLKRMGSGGVGGGGWGLVWC